MRRPLRRKDNTTKVLPGALIASAMFPCIAQTTTQAVPTSARWTDGPQQARWMIDDFAAAISTKNP
jgi:hypothetical protein